jgi:gamma-glutamyl hercynylcysteine S-oxide synthase
MELSKCEVFNILKNKHYLHPNLKQFILESKSLYFDFLDLLFYNKISGLENLENCNPLLWEAYHPIWFMRKLCLSYFNQKFNIENENLIYNSHLCIRKYRFTHKLYNINTIIQNVNDTFNHMLKIKESPENHYLILLSILHLHMHLESYLFTRKVMLNDFFKFEANPTNSVLEQLEFIDIPKGKFIQGSNPDFLPIVFDNEMPAFSQSVNKFKISKTVVTNHIYHKFILEQGYNKKEFWSHYGWKYIQENKINLPKYWTYNNNKINIYFNNKYYEIEQIPNYPVCHISWWEAEAFCKWYGGRMILEKEWEYASIFCNSINPNLNYKKGILPVDSELSKNEKITQMFGNVWEWCQEFIYPYNGYKIDPVYREYSYPFFGFKKVVKGSSWATPDLLNYASYRNAQLPDCRFQYISFRVVKDS